LHINKIYTEHALRAAAKTMLQAIYTATSKTCESPMQPLGSLTSFLRSLESRFLPRIYTTNYDDFFEQAGAEHYFSGFVRTTSACRLFDPAAYWTGWDEPGCFHLHGSVHMGFPNSMCHEIEIGDIAWFPSRADALQRADYTGSGINRMDGTDLMRGAIITGLDKLGRIQQLPFASYYAGFAREAMEADVILVIGSGLSDLHLNTWLKNARRFKPSTPLLYVGYWPGEASDLYSKFHSDNDHLEITLFHDLQIDLAHIHESAFKALEGWTVDRKGTAALWADGFHSFLNEPNAFANVLTRVGAVP
jgi:hypothetical protein